MLYRMRDKRWKNINSLNHIELIVHEFS
jgi:hypothetical protein